ncbi:hypothetical protein [Paraburkholderia aspalathi]|uniref:hypothetical protein n=1 Tax=Paraburkholderia aspalathi TaxID=1324617 RepID=UPI0038B9AE88
MNTDTPGRNCGSRFAMPRYVLERLLSIPESRVSANRCIAKAEKGFLRVPVCFTCAVFVVCLLLRDDLGEQVAASCGVSQNNAI